MTKTTRKQRNIVLPNADIIMTAAKANVERGDEGENDCAFDVTNRNMKKKNIKMLLIA